MKRRREPSPGEGPSNRPPGNRQESNATHDAQVHHTVLEDLEENYDPSGQFFSFCSVFFLQVTKSMILLRSPTLSSSLSPLWTLTVNIAPVPSKKEKTREGISCFSWNWQETSNCWTIWRARESG